MADRRHKQIKRPAGIPGGSLSARPSHHHFFEGEVAYRLMERLRLSRWLSRFPARLVWAAFVFVNGFVAVGMLAGLAVVFHTPLVFPSVGPTAFMLYFMPRPAPETPCAAMPSASCAVLGPSGS
jgi:hypothetical protein